VCGCVYVCACVPVCMYLRMKVCAWGHMFVGVVVRVVVILSVDSMMCVQCVGIGICICVCVCVCCVCVCVRDYGIVDRAV